MVVRIRLRTGFLRPARRSSRGRQSALAVASLMTPLALMAWTLGVWRIAADMKWAGEFAITAGLFSHWQVWFAVGVAVQFAAFLLSRFASDTGEDTDDAALS
jgi:hypothetical protein